MYTTGILGEKIRLSDKSLKELSPAYLAGHKLGRLTKRALPALQSAFQHAQMHIMHSMTANASNTLQDQAPVDYDEPAILRRLGSTQALHDWQIKNGLILPQHTATTFGSLNELI
ncbi:hypothetical protein FXF61_00500 [Pseudomonas sp. C27(2019)]|uniref:hypothetical protein n=1 Tax=Pseudomonas sp. C27(2019) TaxID=2604941 RepID=UPI001249062C|nr:hypothetical protein [Pseudomonas sp. C27(2019)]QEY57751.1 hypothetical protein FXF61_00500 [Pseudomonas sp. C27(2019)]